MGVENTRLEVSSPGRVENRRVTGRGRARLCENFFLHILNAVAGPGIRSRNMSYLRGPDRSEVQLLPPCLDDYVGPGAPARFIDAFVEGLDLQALGFTHAQPATTGRPPYHPADLLKLYLAGYSNRYRSS